MIRRIFKRKQEESRLNDFNSGFFGLEAITSTDTNPGKKIVLKNEHKNPVLRIWRFNKLAPIRNNLRSALLLLLLLLSISSASAELKINCHAPQESDSCISSSITVYANNSGTQANKISLNIILGDGFIDIDPANGTLVYNQPRPNWTSITRTGQTVPLGRNAWSTTISARSTEACGRAHINNVTVAGYCPSGCIYGNDSARARALSPAAYELGSLETLLRSQTDLIARFEGLLENSTLDTNTSIQFLNSYDDLSKRQQEGLEGFDSLVRCSWNDLDETEKIVFTFSFADLLKRQAEIIGNHDHLIQRSYCQLNNSQKIVLLTRLEDRLHREEDLLGQFHLWIEGQKSLDSTQREVWYQFLADFEDLVRRQSRLIACFQQILHSSCDGSFLSVLERANTGDATSKSPINYTIILNNTGSGSIKNIAINNSLLGEIHEPSLIELLPGEERSISRTVSHNCSYCTGCTCKICDFSLVCADVYRDARNITHVCIVGNEVCLNVSEPRR